MSVSVSICRTQSDSMQGKPHARCPRQRRWKTGKGGGGAVNMGRKTWRREEGITKLKTNLISAAAKKKQYLLLGEVCLAACSKGWVRHRGMTLLLNGFCLSSRQIQRCSVCTGKRSGENRVDCIGKLLSADTVAQFYAHIGRQSSKEEYKLSLIHI